MSEGYVEARQRELDEFMSRPGIDPTDIRIQTAFLSGFNAGSGWERMNALPEEGK